MVGEVGRGEGEGGERRGEREEEVRARGSFPGDAWRVACVSVREATAMVAASERASERGEGEREEVERAARARKCMKRKPAASPPPPAEAPASPPPAPQGE